MQKPPLHAHNTQPHPRATEPIPAPPPLPPATNPGMPCDVRRTPGAALRCLWMAVGLWCCLKGPKFPARIGRPYFAYPLTPPALADIRLHGRQFPPLRLVPRVRDQNPVLQVAPVGIPTQSTAAADFAHPIGLVDRQAPDSQTKAPAGRATHQAGLIKFEGIAMHVPPREVATSSAP